MVPSCVDAHATPSHENVCRPKSTPPLPPPAPADTRDGAALGRGRVLWVHGRTQHKKEEGKKGSRRQAVEGGGVRVGFLRGQGCTNRARPGERQKSAGLHISLPYIKRFIIRSAHLVFTFSSTDIRSLHSCVPAVHRKTTKKTKKNMLSVLEPLFYLMPVAYLTELI